MTNAELIATIQAKIEKLIERYGSVKAKGILQEGYKGGRLIGYEDALNILKRIQEDLEKPMPAKVAGKGLEVEAVSYIFDNGLNISPKVATDFARHFYDLGCHRTAEKFDELEYNRQRAEESDKPMNPEGLEEEMDKFFETMPVLEHENIFEDTFKNIAHHFAQWGAEHSGDSEIPNDLAAAAIDIADSLLTKPKDYVLSAKADYWNGAHDGVIAGAKWQADHAPLPEDTVLFNKGVEEGKRLMIEKAVEGEVMLNPYPTICLDDCKDYDFKDGDEVRIIIV